jgi:E3 ubiquitin-protein ligase RNF115/126
VGNPGDYAWGLGGLDTIITQLLNQVEGMGPPPMSKEKIKDLETVEISGRQVELPPPQALSPVQCSYRFY